MYSLVFDTETTGLPSRKRNPALTDQPYIIQLAAVLYEGRRPVSHFSTFVFPEHGNHAGEIPDEKFWQDNGLTHEVVYSSGMPLELSMKMFNQYLRRADRVVAHNMRFDSKLIDYSFERMGITSEHWDTKPKVCTMLTLEPIMKLPAKWGKGYKWPNLDESYRKYVDPAGFSGAHDAMIDV